MTLSFQQENYYFSPKNTCYKDAFCMAKIRTHRWTQQTPRVAPLSTDYGLTPLLDEPDFDTYSQEFHQTLVWLRHCCFLKPSVKGTLEQSNTCPQLLSEIT